MAKFSITNIEKRKKEVKHPVVKLIIIIVALLLVIGVLGTALVQTNYTLSKLSAQMTYMQDTVSVINSNVSNMETNIEATLEEQSSLLESYSVSIVDINFEAQTYTVLIDIVPKEYNDTTVTSVYFGTSEFPLTLEGFYYTGYATLPISETYEQNMTVLFTDGDHRATEVVKSYPGINILGVDYVTAANGFTPAVDDDLFLGSGTVDVTLNGQNQFSFVSVEYEIMMDGEPVYTTDFLAPEVADEDLDSDSDDKDSDEADDNTDEDEDGETDADSNSDTDVDEEVTTANAVSILSQTFPIDYEIPIEEECSVSINLRVTTAEGYVFVYEIYSGSLVREIVNGTLVYELNHSTADRYVTMYDLYGGSYTKVL